MLRLLSWASELSRKIQSKRQCDSMSDIENLIQDALAADAESARFEFKECFDPQSGKDWCEIVKDIIAIANTSGGVIVFGLSSDAQPSGFDVAPVMAVDPAKISDKIYKYTNQQFSDFSLVRCEANGIILAALVISRAPLPMVFEKPGTYDIGQGRQHTAFAAGATYFRHGAKSEPGNTQDIHLAFDRRLAIVREEWLKNVRHVIEAPLGSKVLTIQPKNDAGALGVRLTDDPQAPTIGVLSPDTTHPFRQKDLIEELNKKLLDGVNVNQYDILAIRRIFDIDEKTNFYYQSMFGSRQYSAAFADWIVEQYKKDKEFFVKNRQTMHDRHVNRGKPG